MKFKANTLNKYMTAMLLFIIAVMYSPSVVLGQTTLFSETFDEALGATSGTDNSGNAINWTATCTGCVAGDIFEVNNSYGTGLQGLRGNDTNGPAVFSATGIDATGCYLVTFSFVYESDGYTGSGNNECVSECGSCTGDPADAVSNGSCNNCWDFLSWEVDFGASTDGNVVLGIDCDAPDMGTITSSPACASPYDANGEIIPGNDASNVSIEITMAMWAGAENMVIDDILVLCYTEAEATTAGLAAPAGCNPPPPVTNACNAVITTFPANGN